MFGALGAIGGAGGVGAPWALDQDEYFHIDFQQNRGFVGNSPIGSAASFVTCGRSGSALAASSSGVYSSFSANVPRINDQGVLIEEQRTNEVRNNTFAGAVVSGGELLTNNFFPTNLTGWTVVPAGASTCVWDSALGGNAKLTGDGTNTVVLHQSFSVQSGKQYQVQWTASAATLAFVRIGTTAGGNEIANLSTGTAKQTGTFVAAANATYFLSFGMTAASSVSITGTSVQNQVGPSSWTLFNSGGMLGLVVSIVGLSTVNGIDCMDINWTGTTQNSGAYLILAENSTTIPAFWGLLYGFSAFDQLVAGSFPGLSLSWDCVGYPMGNDFVPGGPMAAPSATFTRKTQGFCYNSATFSGMANAQPRLNSTYTNGAAVNYTYRLGLWQFERDTRFNATITTATRRADATVTFTNGSANITDTAHGLIVGSVASFSNSGGALPTNFTASTNYYIKTVVDANTYTVALTPGGAAVVAGSAGTGTQTRSVNGFGGTNGAQNVMPVGQAVGSATVTISNASPGVVTDTAHGLLASQPVSFNTTGSLPTGLSTNTAYFVRTVLDANSYTVALTPNGTAINTSSAGSGTHTRISYSHTQVGSTNSIIAVTVTGGTVSAVGAVTQGGSWPNGVAATPLIALGGGLTMSLTVAPFDRTGDIVHTSPIRSSGTATTRARDNIRLGGLSWSTSYGLWGSVAGCPHFAAFPAVAMDTGLSLAHVLMTSGGAGRSETPVTFNTANSVAVNTPYKIMLTWDGTGRSLVLNGGTVATDANVPANLASTLEIGDWRTGGNNTNGYIRAIGGWNTKRPSNAQAQAYTT